MITVRRVLPVLALIAGAAVLAPSAPAPARGNVAERIRARLAAPGASVELAAIYAGRDYAPAWSGPARRGLLIDALEQAERWEGAECGVVRAREAAALAGGSDDVVAAMDLELTHALLDCARFRARGRIDPKSQHPGWAMGPRHPDLLWRVENALKDGRIADMLGALAPRDARALALHIERERYARIAEQGGWPALALKRSLKPGQRGADVRALRDRLAMEFPMLADAPADVYGPELEAAVRSFQRTHGLEVDGIVGAASMRALNVSAAARVRQLELAFERLRWQPEPEGRHIRVSIPAFELVAVEDADTVLAPRVIGGRRDWPTPVFSARMNTVVFSPYWNVPASIVRAEIAPAMRRDASYLARNDMKVLGRDGNPVHHASVDWAHFDAAQYRVRQEPGPANPLGGVKFLFPNRYDTYLHDTPAQLLFERAERAFSHGCMRVERADELAAWVLAGTEWDRDAIQRAMHLGAERTVRLAETIPLHVVYETAWIGKDGALHFREDLYGHDARLDAALRGAVAEVVDAVGCRGGW